MRNFKGDQYEETQHMSVVEVAKRVRREIKALCRNGQLPFSKVSVKSDYNSISVQILKGSIPMYRPVDINTGLMKDAKAIRFHKKEVLTEDFEEALAVIKEIVAKYNRDNSDITYDHFDVRFYGSIQHWQYKQV